MREIAALSLVSALYLFSTSGGVINGTFSGDLAAGYGPALFATLWARRDSRVSRYWPSYHYSFWLWTLWPIFIPHYLWATRSTRPIKVALGLLVLLWIPYLASLMGFLLYESLPDYR